MKISLLLIVLASFFSASHVQAETQASSVSGTCVVTPNVTLPVDAPIHFYEQMAIAKMPMQNTSLERVFKNCLRFGNLFLRVGIGRDQNIRLLVISGGKLHEIEPVEPK